MADTWLPDDVGVVRGGETGGDDQVGEQFSVRFHRADRPGAMITRTAYTMNVSGDRERPFLVRAETEWLVCGDLRSRARPNAGQTVTATMLSRTGPQQRLSALPGRWPTNSSAIQVLLRGTG